MVLRASGDLVQESLVSFIVRQCLLQLVQEKVVRDGYDQEGRSGCRNSGQSVRDDIRWSRLILDCVVESK